MWYRDNVSVTSPPFDVPWQRSFRKSSTVRYPPTFCLKTNFVLPFVTFTLDATHFLVIPKKEIASLADLSDEDEEIVGRCVMVASRVASHEGLAGGYRLVANTGDDGGQEVPHLHFHVLGGRKLTWPPG